MILSIEGHGFPAIDRSSMDFPDESPVAGGMEGDELSILVQAIDGKFGTGRAEVKKARPKSQKKPKAGKNKDDDDIGSLVDEEKALEARNNTYKLMEELFSYLGQLKTATNIYKEQFIEYAQKKNEEEPLPRKAKTQDITYNEFEEMVRVKKINDMMSGGRSGGLDGGNAGYERSGATMEEKWQLLKMFAHYKIMAMIRYQFNMT